MKPFFSIIIPMYNCEKYIEQCLKSVICQNFSNYEVVVINDGSTDKSAEIAMNTANNYYGQIKILNKKNGGVASARNMGIRESAGDYVIFLDADDLLDDNSLLKAYYYLDGKKLDMAVCGSYIELVNEIKNENRMFSDEVLLRNKTSIEVKKLCQNMSSMCIGIYRREFLISNNIYVKEGITCAEDTDFFFRCILACESIELIDCSLLIYRYNPKSVTNSISYRNIIDVMNICSVRLNSLINAPSNQIDMDKALDFFATKYIHFAVKIAVLRGVHKQECLKTLNRDKKLLIYV
ncbi:MAG: glycosyltransferase family A protein [Ruminococcus sp.]